MDIIRLIVSLCFLPVRGWVLVIAWGWFVVPFFGLQPLNIPLAIGLILIWGFISGTESRKSDSQKSELDKWAELLGLGVFYPLIFLGIAWVIHLFL